KGRRNITLDSVDALQETIGLPSVKSVFLTNLDFCELLISQLTELIITDGSSYTKQLFQAKENDIQKNLSTLKTDLYY
ncbi:XRE family transcriptional regulator, partial [Streptococcus suis]